MLILTYILLYEWAIWAMMPRKKFGRTSLGIHLATARKRNTRTSKRTFPSRIVGVTGMHKLLLKSRLTSWSCPPQRIAERRKERKRKSVSTLRVDGPSNCTDANVEGCSGFSWPLAWSSHRGLKVDCKNQAARLCPSSAPVEILSRASTVTAGGRAAESS